MSTRGVKKRMKINICSNPPRCDNLNNTLRKTSVPLGFNQSFKCLRCQSKVLFSRYKIRQHAIETRGLTDPAFRTVVVSAVFPSAQSSLFPPNLCECLTTLASSVFGNLLLTPQPYGRFKFLIHLSSPSFPSNCIPVERQLSTKERDGLLKPGNCVPLSLLSSQKNRHSFSQKE